MTPGSPSLATRIDPTTIDLLVERVMGTIRCSVEGGRTPLSSEAGLRFLFAWELGRQLGYSPGYRFDFEWPAFADLDTEDTFLDLLVWTDSSFKVAIEFKLPKKSRDGKNSPSTQTRAKICRDISRLSHLVRTGANSIKVGYFICAADESGYFNEGTKRVNAHYRTYHGQVYEYGCVLPPGIGINGVDRELAFPTHEVRFEWEGLAQVGRGWRPTGRFAWLKPIRVSG